MSPESFFMDARSVLTVVSLATFLAIVFWAYGSRRAAAFSEAANLPFADEEPDPIEARENHHG